MLSIRRVLPLLFLAVSARAQGPNYLVSPNVVYGVASGQELKLDVYRPRDAAAPVPVAMFIHGGGWVAGTKEGSALNALDFLKMGMAVVNVEYRLAKVAPAPAAVEDCRCALRWIIRNAERLKFDANRIVAVGGSAGDGAAIALPDAAARVETPTCAWLDCPSKKLPPARTATPIPADRPRRKAFWDM